MIHCFFLHIVNLNYAHVLDRWESKIYFQELLIKKNTDSSEDVRQAMSQHYLYGPLYVFEEFSHNSAKAPDVDNKRVHRLSYS